MIKDKQGKPLEKTTDEIKIWEDNFRLLLKSKITPFYDGVFEEDDKGYRHWKK